MNSAVGIISVKHRMKEERDACARGILKAGYLPNRMEDWHPRSTRSSCLCFVRRSNIANVAILGGGYGGVMPGFGYLTPIAKYW